MEIWYGLWTPAPRVCCLDLMRCLLHETTAVDLLNICIFLIFEGMCLPPPKTNTKVLSLVYTGFIDSAGFK